MGPIAAYLGIFARPLLSAWINSGFAHDAAPCLQLLVVAALVLALSGPPADVARALNRPVWVVFFTVGVAVLGVGGSMILVAAHGAIGVSAAFVALAAGTFPLLVIVRNRLLGIRPRALVAELLRPTTALAAVSLLYGAAAWASPSLLASLASGAVITIGYAPVAYRWVLHDRERSALAFHNRSS